MIKKISNTVFVNTFDDESNDVFPQLYPSKNLIVNVRVLDKIGPVFKILVNGSLFQSKLPIGLGINDEFLAKVISENPFILALNVFDENESGLLFITEFLLSEIKFELTESIKKALLIILENKKALIKKKLKKLINQLKNINRELNEIEIGLLINLIWESNEDYSEELFGKKDNVFNISFEKLAESIYETFIDLQNEKIPQDIKNLLNSTLVLNLDEQDKVTQSFVLSNKSNRFLKIIKLIDFYNEVRDPYHRTAVNLETLLLKYILQKAVYGKFNIQPEFAILKKETNYELLIFTVEQIDNKLNKNSIRITCNTIIETFGNIFWELYLTSDSINGEISIRPEVKEQCEIRIQNFNQGVNQLLKMFSSIEIKNAKNYPDKYTPLKKLEINTYA